MTTPLQAARILVPRFIHSFLLAACLFAFHVLVLGTFDIYTTHPRVDIPMHFAGGLVIAIGLQRFYTHLRTLNWIPTLNIITVAVLVIMGTATATVVWEFAEFTISQIVGKNIQGSLNDTMLDMFLGNLGGIIIAIIYAVRHRKKTQIKKEGA